MDQIYIIIYQTALKRYAILKYFKMHKKTNPNATINFSFFRIIIYRKRSYQAKDDAFEKNRNIAVYLAKL